MAMVRPVICLRIQYISRLTIRKAPHNQLHTKISRFATGGFHAPCSKKVVFSIVSLSSFHKENAGGRINCTM
jgi:hypothetical protein